MESGYLTGIDFLADTVALTAPKSPLAREAVAQLTNYFCNPEAPFSVPVRVRGTEFQRRVWCALQGIPAGETRSYGDIARQLNSSPRAVGGACRANPLPIVVPCHRVIARQGLGGFAGRTRGREVAIKRWMLAHEGVDVRDRR
jgi:methylated-DNA-[protein]-cysteine S-methyltransferase